MSLIQSVRNMAGRLFQVTRARGLPDEFLNRMTDDSGTIERMIERLMEDYLQPSIIINRFSAQMPCKANSCPSADGAVATRQFVDLDFHRWLWDPSTQDVMREADRKGLRCLDQAEAKSSLDIHPYAMDGRRIILLFKDIRESRSRNAVIDCLVSDPFGRTVMTSLMGSMWDRKSNVFRFVEDHGHLQSWMRILG